jgi:hypothetical protein
MPTFEPVKNFEQIGPHLYELTLSDGSKVEVKMVWAKTQAIIEILLGFGSDIKEALLALIDGNKKAALESVIASLSRDMVSNFFHEADKIACIALDEYDDSGKLVQSGNTSLMAPEDVFSVMNLVMTDITALLKNVLRPTQKQPKKARK